MLKNVKKDKKFRNILDGRMDGRTDGPTDRRTDRPTDRRTEWVVESRARD